MDLGRRGSGLQFANLIPEDTGECKGQYHVIWAMPDKAASGVAIRNHPKPEAAPQHHFQPPLGVVLLGLAEPRFR